MPNIRCNWRHFQRLQNYLPSFGLTYITLLASFLTSLFKMDWHCNAAETALSERLMTCSKPFKMSSEPELANSHLAKSMHRTENRARSSKRVFGMSSRAKSSSRTATTVGRIRVSLDLNVLSWKSDSRRSEKRWSFGVALRQFGLKNENGFGIGSRIVVIWVNWN